MSMRSSIKLDGKRMSFSSETKYLGLVIDENLSMNKHKENVSRKLRNANGAISLIRHHVPLALLRSIYYALFQPHLQYGLQIWGQNISFNSRISRLQKMAVRLMTFSDFSALSKPFV